jgi:hypothetical protein
VLSDSTLGSAEPQGEIFALDVANHPLLRVAVAVDVEFDGDAWDVPRPLFESADDLFAYFVEGELA